MEPPQTSTESPHSEAHRIPHGQERIVTPAERKEVNALLEKETPILDLSNTLSDPNEPSEVTA